MGKHSKTGTLMNRRFTEDKCLELMRIIGELNTTIRVGIQMTIRNYMDMGGIFFTMICYTQTALRLRSGSGWRSLTKIQSGCQPEKPRHSKFHDGRLGR